MGGAGGRLGGSGGRGGGDGNGGGCGGSTSRGPQSEQSVPSVQKRVVPYAPSPPSLQIPSEASLQLYGWVRPPPAASLVGRGCSHSSEHKIVSGTTGGCVGGRGGRGGGAARGPQSAQSVPSAQKASTAPSPPSWHSPSRARQW